MGRRCLFDGKHCGSATSPCEVTHTIMYGKNRPERMIDKRNCLTESSPGDKSYHVPEYSKDFHKQGSTRPVLRYGPKLSPNALLSFIPLASVSYRLRTSFKDKDQVRQVQEEAEVVLKLNTWRPAMPLSLTIPVMDPVNEVAGRGDPKMKKNKSQNAAVDFNMKGRPWRQTF